MIDITLLGTSALIPLPDRALTAVQLVCGGHSILFDCGEGTQTAARKAGVSLIKTDIIALTHFHGDHIFGLMGLLQTMNSMSRTEPLYLVGPRGLEKELIPVLTLVGWTAYPILLMEIPPEGLALDTLIRGWPAGARLSAFDTDHRVTSQGYVFTLPRAGKFLPEKAKALNIPVKLWRSLQNGENIECGGITITPDQVLGPPRKGLKVVFSGDTAMCASLTEAAADADLLICEATYGENQQAQLAIDHGHMNFAQAARTAAQAGVRELWLVHYSQMIEDPESYLENATAHFPRTLCGFDGKQCTLRFEK